MAVRAVRVCNSREVCEGLKVSCEGLRLLC